MLSIFIIKNYSSATKCNLSLTVSHSSNKLLGLHILKVIKMKVIKVLKVHFLLQSIF